MALILAVDRQILADKVAQFGEQPSYALVPPGIDGYVPFSPEYADWTQADRDHEARRLYEQAGYSEDRPLRIEIRYNTSENHKKMALAVASMWKQVLGVNSTLVNEEFRVFLQNRAQKVVTQVFRAGWISDYNDPYSFLELFRSGHGRNDYGYSQQHFRCAARPGWHRTGAGPAGTPDVRSRARADVRQRDHSLVHLRHQAPGQLAAEGLAEQRDGSSPDPAHVQAQVAE